MRLLEKTLDGHDIPYKITHYEDGAEAIPAVANWDALPPDLILLDLNLPRGEGFDVLTRVRPVGILTSSEAPNDRQRAALIGVERNIHKPPCLGEFLLEVGNVIEDLLRLAHNP